MSLLLLFVDSGGTPPEPPDYWQSGNSPNPWPVNIHIGAEEPLGMRPPRAPLTLQPLRNEYIRVVEDFNITYTLLNRAVMSCRTVDGRTDIAGAYRPVTNQRVKVLTKDGLATVFSGRIINVKETSMEPGARTGTTLLVDVVDDQEIFEYTWLTRTFGSEPVAILSVVAHPTSGIINTVGPHGLITGAISTIEGISGPAAVLNGTHTVTIINAESFSVPVPLASSQTVGGTVRGRVYLRDAIDAVLIETDLVSRGIVRDPTMDLGPLLEYYAFDTKISEIWKTLFGAAGWVYRLLPDKTLQAFLPGSKTTTFEFNEKTCLGSPEIVKTRSGFANTVRVEYGSNAVTSKLDVFTADGITNVWKLSYKPYFDANGIFVGNVGGMVTPDYIPVPYDASNTTHEWMVSVSTQELIHNINFPPLPIGLVIHLGYGVQFPQIVEVKDQDLIDEQGGKWTTKLQLPDVYETNTAIEQGQRELDKVKVQPRRVTFATRDELVMPGTTVPVNFPVRLMTDDVAQWMVWSVSITEDDDGLFRYRYTIQEDNQYHPGWQDFFKSIANSGSTGTVSTASNIPPTSSGLSGIGTAGALVKWASASALTDASNIAEITGGIQLNGFLRGSMGGANDFELQNNGGGVVFRVPVGSQNLQMVGNITTGPATDLNLVPAGSVVLSPASKLLLPNAPYDTNIGTISRKFLTLHAAELWVETLVAQQTMATIGGRILVGPTTTLTRDLSPTDIWIYVKHNNLFEHIPFVRYGSRVILESDGKFEMIWIGEGAPIVQADGSYAYSIAVRGYDGTPANQWYAGDAVFDTGYWNVTTSTGGGFIDIYSVRGVNNNSHFGPTIVGNVRTGPNPMDWEPNWALGHLQGIFGYPAGAYGAVFGKHTQAYISIDQIYGYRAIFNGTVFAQIDMAGNSYFAGYMTVMGGIATAGIVLNGGAIVSNAFNWGVTPGFYLGWNGVNYVLLIGNGTSRYVVWDGSSLVVRASSVYIGAIVIDDNGLQIPLNSSGSSAKLVIGSVIIDASAFGQIFIGGGVSAIAFDAVDHVYSSGYIRADGDLECFSTLKCHQGVEWTNVNFNWTGGPTTTADDYPLVHSQGNNNVYKKTNGYNGNLSFSGISGIIVQRGIVTGTF